MLVYDFMLAIIQHVPEKNEKLIRCYGSYSRRNAGKIIEVQLSITKPISLKISKDRVVYCSFCKERMEFVAYVKKPPPKNKEKITTWLEMQ